MNTTINLRGLTEGEYTAAQAHASAAGQSLEGWVRGLVRAALAAPIVKVSYKIRAIGPDAARATIGRWRDGLNAIGAANMSQDQAAVYRHAKLLIERNGPGDRERAIGLLQSAFEDVFEVAG